MRYIAHRGNVNQKKCFDENKPQYIEYALSLGYDAEIDLWCVKNQLYLGHDEPQYTIKNSFVFNDRLWCHCKNNAALFFCSKYNDINFFWHETDRYTITSKKTIWAYPGCELNANTVCVLPESTNNYYISDIKKSYGICSDIIEYYKKLMEF